MISPRVGTEEVLTETFAQRATISLKDGLGRARHAEDDLVNAVSANHRLQIVSRSQHLPAADCPALQCLVVVYEPDDFEIGLPQLAQQAKARLPRASQQQALADRRRGRCLFSCAGAIVKNAPGETPANQSGEHQERMNHQDTEGDRRAGKHARRRAPAIHREMRNAIATARAMAATSRNPQETARRVCRPLSAG